MEVPMPVEEAPVEPAYLVILAIGIIVAPLSATHFVAHLEHRRTNRREQDYNEVFYLAASQPLDLGILSWTFDPTVPGEVVVRPVRVAFAVRLVVLGAVRDQIAQREAVMTGHKVDALLRLPFLVPEHIWAAKRSLRQQPYRPAVAFDKAADIVAKPPVPLLPAVADKGPHLIEAGGVPRLGDQFGAGEDGIRLDVPEDRRIFERLPGF